MIYKKSTGEFWERDRYAPTFLDKDGKLLPDFIKIDRDYLKANTLPNCDTKYFKSNVAGDKILEKTLLEKQKVDDDLAEIAQINADAAERVRLITERMHKTAEDELIAEDIIDAKV